MCVRYYDRGDSIFKDADRSWAAEYVDVQHLDAETDTGPGNNIQDADSPEDAEYVDDVQRLDAETNTGPEDNTEDADYSGEGDITDEATRLPVNAAQLQIHDDYSLPDKKPMRRIWPSTKTDIFIRRLPRAQTSKCQDFRSTLFYDIDLRHRLETWAFGVFSFYIPDLRLGIHSRRSRHSPYSVSKL